MYEHRRSSGTPAAIITVAITLFVIGAALWMEDRFSPTVALVTFITIAGAFLIVVGWMLALATMRSTLQATSDWNHDMAGTERYRQQAFKELVRSDGQIRVLDAKRIDQIAQQRAGLLVDLERQRQQGQQPAGKYLTWDNEGDGQYQEWE
jgi:hypothetical protein